MNRSFDKQRYETIIERYISNSSVPDLISYRIYATYILQVIRKLINSFKLHQSKYYNDTNVPFICFAATLNGGIGNKMRGLLSSILFSIVVNRTFTICNWPSIFEYFAFQFPNRLDHHMPDNYVVIDYTTLIQQSKHQYRINNTEDILAYKGIIIISAYDYFTLFEENNVFFQKYKTIISDLDQPKPIYSNHFYHYLLNYEIFLSNHITTIVDSFTQKYFNDTLLIGLHIRTGSLPNRFESKSFFYKHNSSYLIQEAINIYNLVKPLYKSTNIFLVTDNIKLKQQLSFHYPCIIIYNSSVGHSSQLIVKQYSKIAADSLIEMYLLSKCDIIVKTDYSSFSNTSKLIGGHF